MWRSLSWYYLQEQEDLGFEIKYVTCKIPCTLRQHILSEYAPIIFSNTDGINWSHHTFLLSAMVNRAGNSYQAEFSNLHLKNQWFLEGFCIEPSFSMPRQSSKAHICSAKPEDSRSPIQIRYRKAILPWRNYRLQIAAAWAPENQRLERDWHAPIRSRNER